MLNKFDIYKEHYSLQWLKSMRTGSALLHCWSAALEEFDFTIHYRPRNDQGHVDGPLPVEGAPPEGVEATLSVQMLSSQEVARQVAQELYRAIHVWGNALWKLFRDRFTYVGGKKVARSCIRCQIVTDYGAMQKTASTIMSLGQWDTLSINLVGPLPVTGGWSILSHLWSVALSTQSWFPQRTTQHWWCATLFLSKWFPISGFPGGSCQKWAGNSWNRYGTSCIGH